uniref:Uncharacterized protein n=1 Tax=Aegilops tauschii subsp. strangulata TaxID=200361 RepID=A0A453RWZ6_AEGTS
MCLLYVITIEFFAFNQYKAMWRKYVEIQMEFLTLCKFGFASN